MASTEPPRTRSAMQKLPMHSRLETNMAFDVAILVVNQNELNAALQVLSLTSRIYNETIGMIYLGTLKCPRADSVYRIGLHAQVEAGSGGIRGSQLVVKTLVDSLSPKLVVGIGVAYAIDRNMKIGDVMASTQILPVVKLRRGEKVELRENHIPIDGKVVTALQGVALAGCYDAPVIDDEAGTKSSFRIGSMFCGECLVDDTSLLEEYLRLWHVDRTTLRLPNGVAALRNVLGGEMEGTGMHVGTAGEKVPFLIIKGVCDYGAKKDQEVGGSSSESSGMSKDDIKEKNQTMASRCAWFFFQEFLVEYCLDQKPTPLSRDQKSGRRNDYWTVGIKELTPDDHGGELVLNYVHATARQEEACAKHTNARANITEITELDTRINQCKKQLDDLEKERTSLEHSKLTLTQCELDDAVAACEESRMKLYAKWESIAQRMQKLSITESSGTAGVTTYTLALKETYKKFTIGVGMAEKYVSPLLIRQMRVDFDNQGPQDSLTTLVIGVTVKKNKTRAVKRKISNCKSSFTKSKKRRTGGAYKEEEEEE